MVLERELRATLRPQSWGKAAEEELRMVWTFEALPPVTLHPTRNTRLFKEFYLLGSIYSNL